MENYFVRCQRWKARPSCSHCWQSTDACWPLSEAIEECKLPGVPNLRCNWELRPLCQVTPAANYPPPSPLYSFTDNFNLTQILLPTVNTNFSLTLCLRYTSPYSHKYWLPSSKWGVFLQMLYISACPPRYC